MGEVCPPPGPPARPMSAEGGTIVQTYTRGLTAYQAVSCEQALEDRCRCPCGGAFHGAKRPGLNFDLELYFLLPDDDPHRAEVPKDGWQLSYLTPDGGGIVERLRALGEQAGALGAIPNPDIRPSAGVAQ